MAERFHAVLSPSAASRWINCPGSVRATLEQQTGGDSGSVYAHEGTAAHDLLELCLRMECAPDELKGAVLHKYTNQAGEEVGHEVDDDMIEAVGHAYDYIRTWQAEHPHGVVHMEVQVHWGAHPVVKLPAEQASGTADVALVDMQTCDVEVIDYKHGAGVVVHALDNEQLKLYAVGVLHDPNIISVGRGAIKELKLVIIQPRARSAQGPVRTSVVSVKELDKWVKDVAVSGRQALKPNAPRTAGKWCRWCSAAPTCRALMDKVMEEAGAQFDPLEGDAQPPRDPQTLSTAELSRAMAAAEMVEAWAKAVRGRVLAMLLGGRDLPGWKLVAGRSTRSWREDEVSDIIKQAQDDFGDPKVYAPRVLLSPAKLEQAFKDIRPQGVTAKAQAARFGEVYKPYIEKSTPAPHVAPVDDPRPAFTPGSEFDPLA